MKHSTNNNRQNYLETIIAEAFKNKDLIRALQAYDMGQAEYKKAISASVTTTIISGNTSNPEKIPGNNNANMDPN